MRHHLRGRRREVPFPPRSPRRGAAPPSAVLGLGAARLRAAGPRAAAPLARRAGGSGGAGRLLVAVVVIVPAEQAGDLLLDTLERARRLALRAGSRDVLDQLRNA